MENLRMLRIEKGLTIMELALEMDVVPSTIQQYETGVNEPKIEMLIRLSDYFHVTIDFLVGRSPVREPINDEDEILASQLCHLNNREAKRAAISLLREVRCKDNK